MRLRKAWLLLALPSLLLCVSIAGAGQIAENRSEIDALARERMERLDIPGAALAIVRGDEIVHLAGYGVANEEGEPVTAETPFLLASLS